MTVTKLVNDLFNAGLITMIITLVLSLGLGFTVAQVFEPMRHWVVMLAMVVVNCGLIPAIAWGVCKLFPLTSEQVIALVLVSAPAAGPAGLKAAQLAKRANMAVAVSFVIVLQLVNIVTAPLWAEAVVTGANVKVGTIIGDLLILVLIPLALGLAGRARYAEHADAWKAGLEKISNIALYIAIGLGIAVNYHVVVDLIGSWVIVVSVVLIAINVVLGWLVGLKDRSTAISASMISAMRFTPIGLIVISTQLHNEASYLAPALVFALVDTVIPFLIGAEIGRKLAPASKARGADPVASPHPATNVG